MSAPGIRVTILWPAIIPYGVWVDLMLSGKLLVPALDDSRPWWREWSRLRKFESSPSLAGSLLDVVYRTKHQQLAVWNRCRFVQAVPEAESQPFGAQNCYRLVRRSASLLLNNHSQFLLAVEYELEPSGQTSPEQLRRDTTTAIKRIQRDRRIAHNLGQDAFAEATCDLCLDEIRRVAAQVLEEESPRKALRNIRLVERGNFPVVSAEQGHLESLESVFSAEEARSQLVAQPGIALEHEGAFVHLGWMYGIVAGIPDAQARKLLPGMLHLQQTYFLLDHFRQYGLQVMAQISRKLIHREWSQEARRFDRLSLQFERARLEHERFMSALYPIHAEVLRGVESLWNLQDGFASVAGSLETQRQFLERRFVRAEQDAVKRQNYYLYAIALLQLFGLFGIAESVFGLREHPVWVTTAISIVCALGILVGIAVLVVGRRRRR